MSEFTDNQAIKFALENELCPVHQFSPEVEILPTGFQIKSCCKEFQSELTSKATKMTADQIRESLVNTFRNGLKH